jgi:hypothetical protein
MLVLLLDGFKNDAVEIGSGAMIYVPNLIKAFRNSKDDGGGIDIQTARKS